jgi:spectinomycin phosphotransferase
MMKRIPPDRKHVQRHAILSAIQAIDSEIDCENLAMLREKPPLADAAIARCVEAAYGLTVETLTFLPIGYDPYAAVYRIDTPTQAAYFLKLTRSAIVPASLHIPRALLDLGIANVLAPLPTMQHGLWCTLEPYSLVLYPFIDGENAMRQGMSPQQWISFGATLNAIHRSGIAARFAGEIPVENFASPMIAQVRSMQQQLHNRQWELPVQQQFAAFWQENSALIQHLTDRAEALGALLRVEAFELVLCHGDVHAANIMLDRDGAICIVDWDTPRIAPRERDLLFVVGSTIARRVTTEEEARFFQGYGESAINWRALAYYRYERVLEDLYECGRSVFFNPASSAAVKAADAGLAISLFQAGEIVQSALEADRRLDA